MIPPIHTEEESALILWAWRLGKPLEYLDFDGEWEPRINPTIQPFLTIYKYRIKSHDPRRASEVQLAVANGKTP